MDEVIDEGPGLGDPLEDLELYALDALPDDERRAFESALRALPERERGRYAARVASFQQVALHLSEPMAAPPAPQVRRELLRRIGAQDPVEAPRRAEALRRRRVWGIAAAAACVCAASVSTAVWYQHSRPDRAAPNWAQAPHEVSAVMTAADAHMAMGTIAGQSSMVAVTYSRGMGKAVVLLSPTTVIPSDKVYQVWVMGQDHSAASGGMFAASQAGRPMVVDGVGTATSIMLSVEPAAGERRPTGAMVSQIQL